MKNRYMHQIKRPGKKALKRFHAGLSGNDNSSKHRFHGIGILMLVFICFIASMSTFAQQGEFPKRWMSQKTPLRHKIYVDQFQNKGTNTDVDFGQIVTEYFSESHASIFDQEIFVPVQTKDEADVVISGDYVFNNISEVVEKPLMERSTSYASRIPYFEIRVKNSADLTFALHFAYKDGTTATDTIKYEEKSESTEKREVKSQLVLEDEAIKTVERKLFDLIDIYDIDSYWVKMPKVKIKDKEMKAQYKEMKDYLEERKIKELGAFYLKLYEEKKSPEVAQCIGICYELLGNYEKANEYYEEINDFATNIRMKNYLELHDYLREIGVPPHQAVEF